MSIRAALKRTRRVFYGVRGGKGVRLEVMCFL